MNHYLVIGSGLIGRLIAWRLIVAGHRVTIVSSDDRTGTDSAGYVAASMLAPYTEAVTAERKIRDLGIQSQALWQDWLQDFTQPILMPNPGTLVVAHEADKAELMRFQHRATHILSVGDFQVLSQSALQQEAPSLAENFSQALFFENEYCLDNRLFFQATTAFLTRHADWHTIENIDDLNSKTLEALCQRELFCRLEVFDEVIDCRGYGSRQNMPDLRGVRGEVIRVHAPEVNISHCVRLMHPRHPLYLAPRADNHYVIGATVLESDDRSPVSVRSAMELLSALYSIDKGFSEARIIEIQSHCRPALPHHLPEIRRQSWGYQVNGFYRHGYLLGPAIVSEFIQQLFSNKVEEACYASY